VLKKFKVLVTCSVVPQTRWSVELTVEAETALEAMEKAEAQAEQMEVEDDENYDPGFEQIDSFIVWPRQKTRT
jgi:hypothetical protein